MSKRGSRLPSHIVATPPARPSVNPGAVRALSGVAVAVVLMVHCRQAEATPLMLASSIMTPTAAPFDDFVAEAAQRFAIPEAWIRAVMQAESAGDVQSLSPKGAMGLMQIMPSTWADLRARYGLGNDAYDPHDNILGGAAYLREMYDLFGTPGFIGAYNAGPARYQDHLTTGLPLPDETVAYMANVGRMIGADPDTSLFAVGAAPAAAPRAPVAAGGPVPAPAAVGDRSESVALAEEASGGAARPQIVMADSAPAGVVPGAGRAGDGGASIRPGQRAPARASGDDAPDDTSFDPTPTGDRKHSAVPGGLIIFTSVDDAPTKWHQAPAIVSADEDADADVLPGSGGGLDDAGLISRIHPRDVRHRGTVISAREAVDEPVDLDRSGHEGWGQVRHTSEPVRAASVSDGYAPREEISRPSGPHEVGAARPAQHGGGAELDRRFDHPSSSGGGSRSGGTSSHSHGSRGGRSAG
jgi:hypothetical protein